MTNGLLIIHVEHHVGRNAFTFSYDGCPSQITTGKTFFDAEEDGLESLCKSLGEAIANADATKGGVGSVVLQYDVGTAERLGVEIPHGLNEVSGRYSMTVVCPEPEKSPKKLF